MKRELSRLVTAVFGILMAFCFTLYSGVNSVQAADTINLTFGGIWPPPEVHPMSAATKLWIEKIEKDTQGRVKIQPFWAGAMYKAKDSATELAKGVTDIGDISGSYAAVGYDFEKSMRMAFWGVNDRILARKVYLEVVEKYPQLEEEFTSSGVKVMAYAGIPPYNLLIAKKLVAKADDLKGMTIKATGDLTRIAAAFGGEGINMPMGETYTALQKTTIDGAFAPYETMKSFRFGEVIKYALELNLGSAPAGHWGFCLKSWDKLPPDIRKVFEDNKEWFGQKIEELVFANDELGINFAKENKVEFIKLPPEELNKIYTVVDKIILEQMAQLDAKGLPGTTVYKDIRRLITEYGSK